MRTNLFTKPLADINSDLAIQRFCATAEYRPDVDAILLPAL